jgi:hypothetical protein
MNPTKKLYFKFKIQLSFFYCILILVNLIACNNKSIRIESNNSERKTDSCLVNKAHSYEIYIPSGSIKCGQLPQLIIIDPHGNGKIAIELFIPSAEKYKFILIASNRIKNKTPEFVSYINELHEDVASKYPVNDQVMLAGFSGGARMVLTYAQYNTVDGVIACGALAAPEEISAVNTVVYGMVGMADFNFIEAAQYLFRPDNAPENLRIEFTEDLHKWPSAKELSRLVGHIYFEKEFTTQKCLNFKSLADGFLTEQTKIISDLKSSGNYISAYMLLQNLAHIDVLNNSEVFTEIYNSVDYEDKLNNQLNLLRESIRFELKVRDSYYKELATKDISWWQHEIKSLNDHINHEKNKYDALAYQRIKAFLGIMCYSLTSNALQSNDLHTASRLLPIYTYLEPENPDMLYFHAIYSKIIGKSKESHVYLEKAIAAGFTDAEKINELNESF